MIELLDNLVMSEAFYFRPLLTEALELNIIKGKFLNRLLEHKEIVSQNLWVLRKINSIKPDSQKCYF